MKTIKVSETHEALVDDETYGFLSRFKWHIQKKNYTFYAKTRTYFLGKPRNILMHRLLFMYSVKSVDHINGNGLDNRLSNLRLASSSQNASNRKYKTTNKNGYRGVFSKTNGLAGYSAQISHNNELRYLGFFKTAKEAAKAFDAAAVKLKGEFATLNFPEDYKK